MLDTKDMEMQIGDAPVKRKSRFLEICKQLGKKKSAMVGLIVFAILVILAILSPYISPYSYSEINMSDAYMGPSAKHIMGTDQLGRDIFSRLMYGARYSISIGLLSTIIGTVAGIFFGSIAGFFGGAVDEVIMRICDILQSIPGMVLNVALSCALGTGVFNCILALSVSGISGSARLIRAQILSIRKMEYVDAAGVINCSTAKIIVKHILPNSISPCIVGMTMGIGGSIMAASSLSYLGLGVQSPIPEWGAMLSEGRSYLSKFPHMCIFPGLAIMVTVLALNLFGDGLRDALDPKLKK